MSKNLGNGRITWSAAVFIGTATYLFLRVPSLDFLLLSNDQSYQMALGMAVTKGRMPGFDFITQYGPGVAFASYLGFAATGNAAGEMLMSIIGYATAIVVAMNIVRRSVGHVLALLAVGGMLLWFPRFYKWYYCLFPILSILFAQSFFLAIRRWRYRILLLVIWAQVVGVGGLFRYDLFLEGNVFGALAILAAYFTNGASHRVIAICNVILFIFASLLLPLIYIVAIFVICGEQQLLLFLQSIFSGVTDTVGFYGIAPFQFSWFDGISSGNALALLQIIFPVVYSVGVVIGCFAMRFQTEAPAFTGFTLFCSSLAGFGVYPQSLHRADLQHLLQVMYPFIITCMLLLSLFVTKLPIWALHCKLAGGLTVASVIVIMLKLLPGSSIDLGPLSRNPVLQWKALANLPESDSGNPVADMASALRRLTPSNAKVFFVMAPTDMALLFFAQRYQPGLFPVYETGMFSSDFWIRQNRAALESSPPDYLVVLSAPKPRIEPAPFMPDLLDRWRSSFKMVLYRNGQYVLLKKY